jgi:hypothetical protein
MGIRPNWIIISVAVAALPGAAPAQIGPNLTAPQLENQQALRRYQWTSRMEVRVDGEVRLFTVTMVHYDSRGKLQETQIGGGEKSERRVRQSQESQAQIKRDKLDKQVLDVTREVRRYYSPTDKQLDALRSGARPASGAEGPADADCLTMSGWLKPDDRISLWIDRATGLQRRIEVAGTAGSQRFTAVSTLEPLKDGPWYVAQNVIDIPELKVQIVTENSGHMRVARAPSLPAGPAAYQAAAHQGGMQ